MIGTIDITDTYMKALSTLSVDKKLDLISKLTDSIRKTQLRPRGSVAKNPFAGLSGAWENDGKEAEKLIDEIRAARYFE